MKIWKRLSYRPIYRRKCHVKWSHNDALDNECDYTRVVDTVDSAASILYSRVKICERNLTTLEENNVNISIRILSH